MINTKPRFLPSFLVCSIWVFALSPPCVRLVGMGIGIEFRDWDQGYVFLPAYDAPFVRSVEMCFESFCNLERANQRRERGQPFASMVVLEIEHRFGDLFIHFFSFYIWEGLVDYLKSELECVSAFSPIQLFAWHLCSLSLSVG
jgi:hypothetical protein